MAANSTIHRLYRWFLSAGVNNAWDQAVRYLSSNPEFSRALLRITPNKSYAKHLETYEFPDAPDEDLGKYDPLFIVILSKHTSLLLISPFMGCKTIDTSNVRGLFLRPKDGDPYVPKNYQSTNQQVRRLCVHPKKALYKYHTNGYLKFGIMQCVLHSANTHYIPDIISKPAFNHAGVLEVIPTPR